MPHACCVPSCNGNYASGPRVRVFGFPKEDELRRKWIRAILREDFVPTPHSRVCELHFTKSDFITINSFFDEKTGRTISVPYKFPKLKKDIIPTVFLNLPERMTKKITPHENPKDRRKRFNEEAVAKAVKRSKVEKALGVKIKNVYSIQEPIENLPERDPWISQQQQKEVDSLHPSQNEDMILPDVKGHVSSSALIPAGWPAKRAASSSEDIPMLKVIKQEVPDVMGSASDFYDYPNPNNYNASLTVNSEDQFDKFGKHVTCQLKELPLRNALMLREAIQSLITKERIACQQSDSVLS